MGYMTSFFFTIMYPRSRLEYMTSFFFTLMYPRCLMEYMTFFFSPAHNIKIQFVPQPKRLFGGPAEGRSNQKKEEAAASSFLHPQPFSMLPFHFGK